MDHQNLQPLAGKAVLVLETDKLPIDVHQDSLKAVKEVAQASAKVRKKPTRTHVPKLFGRNGVMSG